MYCASRTMIPPVPVGTRARSARTPRSMRGCYGYGRARERVRVPPVPACCPVGGPEAPALMVARGKDATRGTCRIPANTQVWKRGMTTGRKLREGQGWRPLAVANPDELVSRDRLGRDKPRGRSTWMPEKAGQWRRMLDLSSGDRDRSVRGPRRQREMSTMRERGVSYAGGGAPVQKV